VNFEQVFSLTVSGITVGMIYALIALGYTMVYGVLEFINFAHGEVFTFGGIIASVMLVWTGVNDSMPVWLRVVCLAGALVCAVLVTMGLGLVIERFAYRPLRGRSRIIPLLAAIGVSIVLQQLMILVFGPDSIILPQSVVPAQFVTVFGSRIRLLAFIIIGVSIVLMLALTYIVRSTRIGKAMRATSLDIEAAQMMGIETNRVIAFTFAVGSALAAIGGLLVTMYYGSIRFDSGYIYGLKAFTAAVLGGIGSIPGAVIGSLILGLAEIYGVGLNLGLLMWFFVAGLVLGLYVQLVRVPKRRLQHIRDEDRTPAYERDLVRLYRLAPVYAVRVALAKRTDALMAVSARHALRLTLGNVFLAVMAVVFYLNGRAQIDPQWQNVIAFAVLMIILLFRPSGLLGEHTQEKV
jgi:branched-chain amino acid transport system permease protein